MGDDDLRLKTRRVPVRDVGKESAAGAVAVPTPAVASPPTTKVADHGWSADVPFAVVPNAFGTTALTPMSTPGQGKKTSWDLRVGRVELSGLSHPSFEQKLDATTGSLARAGNVVRPLFDGKASFAERSKVIAAAERSICLQTFIFTDDDTGWALARQLADKARAGVDVKVIYDALGSNRADEKIFDFMRAAGVQIRAYATGMDLLSANDRWHEKHLVVDGKVAIEGGMNIADEYAFGGSGRQVFRHKDKPNKGEEAWRDVDVRIEGPAVADIEAGFLRNWHLLEPTMRGWTAATNLRQVGPTVATGRDTVAVRFVQHHPQGDPPDDHTLQLYLHAIRHASTSITIENAYFVPPKALREALIEAAKRGVCVRVMTNSRASSDMGFVVDAARYFYDELLAAGVEIYEKRGGTLHSKTATFDGCYSIIGSCNLNGRSDGRDTESVVAVRCDTTARELEQRFDGALAGAEVERITLDMVKADSVLTDIKQWAVSTIAWTV